MEENGTGKTERRGGERVTGCEPSSDPLVLPTVWVDLACKYLSENQHEFVFPATESDLREGALDMRPLFPVFSPCPFPRPFIPLPFPLTLLPPVATSKLPVVGVIVHRDHHCRLV